MSDKYIKETLKDWTKEEQMSSDALLRQAYGHNLKMISDADRKARIIMVVNSILLTLGVTIITKLMDHVHYAWISGVILIFTNLLSLFFCLLSIRPEIKSHLGKEVNDNILHYSKASEYSFKVYSERVHELLHNNEEKIDSLIKDLYFFGNLLTMKYRLMKVSFRVFYWGLAVSILSYIVFVLLRSGNNY